MQRAYRAPFTYLVQELQGTDKKSRKNRKRGI